MSSMEKQASGQDETQQNDTGEQAASSFKGMRGWGRSGLSEKTRVLSLEKFVPVTFQSGENASRFIAAYLVQLIREQETHGGCAGCCYLLPSLTSLARFFGVSAADVRKAFWNMKTEGFDYILPGYYGHVTLWARGARSPVFKRPLKPDFIEGR